MKIILRLFLGLALVVVLILMYATTKPATFRVERSTTINAPPSVVHEYLVDFHKWRAWSPWEKYDPDMKRTHEGPSAGKGAFYSWDGKNGVGTGRMEIESETPVQVDIKLDFSSPMETHNKVIFALLPQGSATQVTWTMTGNNNLLSKVMQLFASMDSMIGKDFESGLSDLKTVSEKAAAERTAQPAAAP